MTLITDEVNINHTEVLFVAKEIIQLMNDERSFPNIKIENVKTARRAFGDLLDFNAVSKSNPELRVEASISINKILGVRNSMMIKTYCQIDERFR